MSLPGNGPKAALPKKMVNLTIYYGSGSGFDLRQVKVSAPVPACFGSVSTPQKAVLKNIFVKNLAFNVLTLSSIVA